mmetsp:Transcript_4694/g.14320  ORF Transcript_4694/g.14320 Transcript_4694/m.14320 type:complete len:239 (+) Transcript_4694:818-1534(+)
MRAPARTRAGQRSRRVIIARSPSRRIASEWSPVRWCCATSCRPSSTSSASTWPSCVRWVCGRVCPPRYVLRWRISGSCVRAPLHCVLTRTVWSERVALPVSSCSPVPSWTYDGQHSRSRSRVATSLGARSPETGYDWWTVSTRTSPTRPICCLCCTRSPRTPSRLVRQQPPAPSSSSSRVSRVSKVSRVRVRVVSRFWSVWWMRTTCSCVWRRRPPRSGNVPSWSNTTLASSTRCLAG